MLNLKYVHHFIAAVDGGSFSEAASQLNISHTSIRHSVEQLELLLNCILLVRRPAQGVTVTKEGQRFHERAKMLLEDAEDISSMFTTDSDQILRGKLTIGCQEGLTWSLIPRAIDRMNELHPQLEVSMRTIWMETKYEMLDQGEVDVLITFIIEKTHPAKYDVIDLCAPQACAMMRKGHPLDNGQPVDLMELAKYPHIFIDDGPALRLFYGMYEDRDLKPNIRMYSNISTGAQAIVGRTDAVSLRIVRPAIPLTPLGDLMVMPMIKNKVQRPRLIAAFNHSKTNVSLDKRVVFTDICTELFESDEMRDHIYY